MSVIVGTSGWHYADWHAKFYPADLKPRDWLSYYSRRFSSVEVNNSFYQLPSEKAFQAWRECSPEGFIFALKGSRLVTHYRKLQGVEEALDLFYQRARLLGEKLGPVLYQLPPSLRYDEARLKEFLALLPKDVLHAIEFRHASWFNDSTYTALSDANVAFCIFHLIGLDCPRVVTTRFAYLRFHGTGGKYWGRYSDGMLDEWAQWIAEADAGDRQVYAYFNNDMNADAVADASALLHKLRTAR